MYMKRQYGCACTCMLGTDSDSSCEHKIAKIYCHSYTLYYKYQCCHWYCHFRYTILIGRYTSIGADSSRREEICT